MVGGVRRGNGDDVIELMKSIRVALADDAYMDGCGWIASTGLSG